MRVVIKGIERLDGQAQQLVRKTVALLKRKYPVDAHRQLTIQFCSLDERRELWRQGGCPPDGFFDNGAVLAATISDRFRADTIVECIGRAWKTFELVTAGTMRKDRATFAKVDRFGKKIAKAIAKEEAA